MRRPQAGYRQVCNAAPVPVTTAYAVLALSEACREQPSPLSSSHALR